MTLNDLGGSDAITRVLVSETERREVRASADVTTEAEAAHEDGGRGR